MNYQHAYNPLKRVGLFNMNRLHLQLGHLGANVLVGMGSVFRDIGKRSGFGDLDTVAELEREFATQDIE